MKLCDCSGKKMESADQDKLHRARLTFISSIVSPSDKEAMLELITHCLPYTQNRLDDKALQAAASIGAGAKKQSTSACRASVACLLLVHQKHFEDGVALAVGGIAIDGIYA